jgi:hypothetical protein
MSAIILGSNLLGSTLLGSKSQGHPSASSPSQGEGGQTSSQGRGTTPPNISQGTGPLPSHTMARNNPPKNLPMPYLASINIPDLTKLTNDPILHDPTWPNMPTKLPSDIPKFEGKPGDDPTNHVMTFHLWCSLNNIMDDSIDLRLFQRTLTGSSAKWYVDEKSGSQVTFESLDKSFLSFFQLPVHHDTGLEILSDFKETTVIHIVNHIHEWNQCHSFCKEEKTKQNVLIGLSNHSSLLSPKMSHPIFLSQKRKPSTRPNSLSSSMLNQVTYTQCYLMHPNPYHLTRTNLRCPMLWMGLLVP